MQKFPIAMNHNSVTPSKKLYANSFLSVRSINGVTPNRKLYAKKFPAAVNPMGSASDRKLLNHFI